MDTDSNSAITRLWARVGIWLRENPISHWARLSGNRMHVTLVLLLAVFFVLLTLSFVKPVDMQQLVAETTAARALFTTLLSGAILLVSIVASINSTALSQEITDIESQQERINAAITYRQNIEEVIQQNVTPAEPAEFLTVILGAIAQQTQSLSDAAADHPDEEFQRLVDAFVSDVAADLDRARTTLRSASIGSFQVLIAGLNYDYTGQIHVTRRFKLEFEDSLDDEDLELLDNLINTLEFFGTGREYYKSLYYERELAKLSSHLLYVSLPVIVFTSYVIFALDGNIVPELSVYTVSSFLLFVSFAFTIALAPYVILTAYIIRLSTITLQTLASGPFIFRQRSHISVFEQESPDEIYQWDLPGDDE